MTTTTFPDLEQVMDSLNGYTGYKGHDDNDNKIWADLDPTLQNQPYCAATDCYLWKHAGHPFPKIDHAWGFSFCPDAVIWAKKNGLWAPYSHREKGDTTFYDFSGHGVAEHTGTVTEDEDHDPRNVHDFEGNTYPQNGGNQADGDGCYFRSRPVGSYVMGVLKSSRWLSDHPDHTPPPKPTAAKHNPFHYDARGLPLHIGRDGQSVGSRGEDVRWAQWALSIPVDGQFGRQTLVATRLFQKRRGLTIDGVVGQQTASALARVTH